MVLGDLDSYMQKSATLPQFFKIYKILIWKNISTPMFIAALVTIAKIWKEPKGPRTDEWIKQLWDIYTTEFYSAIKKKKNLPFANLFEYYSQISTWTWPKKVFILIVWNKFHFVQKDMLLCATNKEREEERKRKEAKREGSKRRKKEGGEGREGQMGERGED